MFNVVNENAVFAADIETVFLPEFSELPCGGGNADSLESFKPDDLNIQIIIGVEFGGPEIVVIGFVELLVTLIGCADNAAEGFADPTAEDTVKISCVINRFFHFIHL